MDEKETKTLVQLGRGKTVYCGNKNCFAARKSKKTSGEYFCTALADNDFGGKPCPFFKTKEFQARGLKIAEERRIRLAQERAKRDHLRTISGVMFTKKGEKNDGKI